MVTGEKGPAFDGARRIASGERPKVHEHHLRHAGRERKGARKKEGGAPALAFPLGPGEKPREVRKWGIVGPWSLDCSRGEGDATMNRVPMTGRVEEKVAAKR